MRDEMAITANVKRFLYAVQQLRDRSHGVEGMGLLWGQPGEGKSTVIAKATNVMDGIYLRAMRSWTTTEMLGALCEQLDLPKSPRKAPMINGSVKSLMEFTRPVFVDEADYLMKQAELLDVLRDIYDMTGAPIILIGMQEFARKLSQADNGRFARRITQWIQFKGIDMADTRILADTVCEVMVADDLLAELHQAAKANIGRMTTGLSRIETFGRTNQIREVALSDWGRRDFFYDQPSFTRRNRRAS